MSIFWKKTDWLNANTDEVTLKLNLSQIQVLPKAREATLAPASYCEPTFTGGTCCTQLYAKKTLVVELSFNVLLFPLYTGTKMGSKSDIHVHVAT